MIDAKRIRQNPQEIEEALAKRGVKMSMTPFLENERYRLSLLARADEKKSLRNTIRKKVGMAKKEKGTESLQTELLQKMKELNREIQSLDTELLTLEKENEAILLSIPNPTKPTVPAGHVKDSCTEVRRFGEPRRFPWEPKTANELLSDLELIIIPPHTNESSEPSAVYRGMGARLLRNIANLVLDILACKGYEECSLLQNLSLSELFKNHIFSAAEIPKLICASSWNQIDLMHAVAPGSSYDSIETMLISFEKALQILGLPYRATLLSADKTPFDASYSVALSVWVPSRKAYSEIALCSAHDDFSSRRFSIRFKESPKDKPKYVHTLHGSFSLDVCIAALLENYQNEDGSVQIPDCLSSLMNCTVIR